MEQGKLTRWNDDKGFGFIKPEKGGQDIFFHISALKSVNCRPQVGDTIYYQIAVDQQGKNRACNVLIKGAKAQKITKSKPQSKFFAIILKSLFLSILPIGGSIFFALKASNLIPLILYIVMSVITFGMYADDKSRAKKGQWRVPEKTLHLCEILGGWIGGFIAQQKLRHKSSKASYQVVFWGIVSVHMIFWADWIFKRGQLLKLILNLHFK